MLRERRKPRGWLVRRTAAPAAMLFLFTGGLGERRHECVPMSGRFVSAALGAERQLHDDAGEDMHGGHGRLRLEEIFE